MGDHADDAVNESIDFMNFCDEHRFDSVQNQYDLGLIDEQGCFLHDDAIHINPHPKKESGPGECPKCGSKTVLRKGKFGLFWGCETFPSCKGSRKIQEGDIMSYGKCHFCGDDLESPAINDDGSSIGSHNLQVIYHEPGGSECKLNQERNKIEDEKESNRNKVRCHSFKIKELKSLLLEAADSVHASLAETDISENRRQYRVDLENRLRESINLIEKE